MKSVPIYNSYYWGNKPQASMKKVETQNAYDDIFGFPDGNKNRNLCISGI